MDSSNSEAGRSPSPRDDYRRGARASAPMLPGTVLFGLATGAATVSAGLSQAVAFVMPAGFYAGVAQLSYVQLAATAAPFASILLTVAATQLRYLIYAGIASTWPRPEGLFFRLVPAYFITETSFALSLAERPESRLRFIIGAGAPLWVVWSAACIIGALLAGQLPPVKHAHAVPAIVLAPILARQLQGRARLLAGLAAVALGLALVSLPLRLGPLLAALLAVASVLTAMRFRRAGR